MNRINISTERKKRTFTSENFNPSLWQNIEPYYDQLLEREIKDIGSFREWLTDRSELESIISENANGEQYIYIIENKDSNNEGNAKRIIIETGKSQGDVIEVTKGLENNAEIIQEGARSVNDGQTVKVINQ